MQFEVGEIIEGKVKTITKFGTFVELSNEKMGLVHISEVSEAYVKEISDHLKIGQNVKVKILKIKNDGKIELSIKQALKILKPVNFNIVSKNHPFEDMINKFKKSSDEKLAKFAQKNSKRKNNNSDCRNKY